MSRIIIVTINRVCQKVFRVKTFHEHHTPKTTTAANPAVTAGTKMGSLPLNLRLWMIYSPKSNSFDNSLCNFFAVSDSEAKSFSDLNA